ncbi:MAG TPA: ferritin-like domain-containing protein [Geminicoccaceae bacterium]|nr:ferritin-like domain-containing protein [Geminicoccaceae bacterium]
MANVKDNFVPWLRDARAMESQAVELLEKQAPRLDNYPQLQARIRQHLEETHRQAEMLDRCLERYGTDRSMIKEAITKIGGTLQALWPSMSSDEVVKGAITGYAFEHWEIGNYRALIAAADELGDMETKRVLQEILQQEEAMASFLEQHLPDTTREFLRRDARSEAGAKA